MSTDDFTEAARAEAEGKFPPPRESAVIYPLSAVRSHSRGAFLAGAEWARTYPAAQEPSDAEVEAAVLGELAHLQGYDLAGEEDRAEVLAWWAGMDEEVRASRLDTARAALSAARAAQRDEETR
ncbi:hypothetical protein M3G50_07465 [Brachybacterium muris]|uniref:hypothetical protein n=1 Tax=Brachybacterium muris TaxID=219301 RepID=UPI0021A80C67|nr:hypothetical protein [Brachybacterium muris]MCT1430591.1 hypothetical protein [Brachybacterium muris]